MKAIGTLIIFAGLVAVGNAQDEAKKELEKLQGTWKIQNAKIAGSDYPAKSLTAQTITFSGDTITCKEIPGKGNTAKAKLDATKTPPVILCEDKKGKIVRQFVYQQDGDNLKVIFIPVGSKQSADIFAKPGVDVAVLTFKREKK